MQFLYLTKIEFCVIIYPLQTKLKLSKFCLGCRNRVKFVRRLIFAGMAELADALDSGFYTIFDEFPICRNIPKRLAFSAEKRCAVGT